MTILRRVGRFLRRLFIAFLLLITLLFGLQYSTYPFGLQWNAVADIASPYQFDYITWEAGAIARKVDQTLFGLHPFMTESARSQFIHAYMADLAAAQTIESQINTVFTDPAVPDPETASSDLRANRDTLRMSLLARQSLAEAILEGQVAQLLVEQGFATLGQVLPPVSAHFTRVPNLLVVSPRDRIRFDISINLNPMTTDQIDSLEQRIAVEQGMSALIVPLGGIALYPAMVLETASIPYALDTIAHEWLHHYLFFFPLGLQYFNGESFVGETRTINETTAVLFGQQMSRLTLARYYPDLLTAAAPGFIQPVAQTASQPFDFAAEMDRTRRRVDELLAGEQVAEAEAYMEERRALFVSNGYLIRKLNQAYFAFYGGYQAGSTASAAGADPIGPAIRLILETSPTLQDFVVTMRAITSREQLLAIRDQRLATRQSS